MNIEDFRTYCLSFRGVSEKMPFGKATSDYDRNLLVFYVLDKWFCFVNIDLFDFCTIKCASEDIARLQELYEDVIPAYHMNKKHWISVRFNSNMSDETVRELVRRSYETVVGAMTRKQRELLELLPEAPAPDYE